MEEKHHNNIRDVGRKDTGGKRDGDVTQTFVLMTRCGCSPNERVGGNTQRRIVRPMHDARHRRRAYEEEGNGHVSTAGVK